jgi:hypothetical protein
MEAEAKITYTKSICDDYALIGLEWGETERHSDDFDLGSLGHVLANGTESRKQIGWAVYAKGRFSGRVGDTITLREKVIGG